jgi:hypothetical protein
VAGAELAGAGGLRRAPDPATAAPPALVRLEIYEDERPFSDASPLQKLPGYIDPALKRAWRRAAPEVNRG